MDLILSRTLAYAVKGLPKKVPRLLGHLKLETLGLLTTFKQQNKKVLNLLMYIL